MNGRSFQIKITDEAGHGTARAAARPSYPVSACFVVVLLVCSVRIRAEAYYLVDNFTTSLNSGDGVRCEVESVEAKVGLASARVFYQADPRQRRATLGFPEAAKRIPGPGLLKLWVKGDASGNDMELVLRHALVKSEPDGRRMLFGHRDFPLPRIRLDFDVWREIELDARSLPAEGVAWWHSLNFWVSGGDKPRTSGMILLDDLRLYPVSSPPASTFAAGLVGPPVREFTSDVAVFLDVRNFAANPGKVRARIAMTDRNETLVADRDFTVELAAGEGKETRLDLAPDKLDAYLPPFTIDCDIVSADLPSVAMRQSIKLVMGNSLALFDDFSDVFGRWFTSGYLAGPHGWNWTGWAQGERQRYSPFIQTAAAISRVQLSTVQPTGDATQEPGNPQSLPLDPRSAPGAYAMRVDYVGNAVVWSGSGRHLPGNPYRLGLWVKGDGSGSRLAALFLDYTDGADFWEGGWKRINNGERTLCTLDFADWRYVEVDLPGNGIGSNTKKGSSDALDFPLELTGFQVYAAQRPADPRQPSGPKVPVAGSILIGPILVHTQDAPTASLSVHIAYDDPDRRYAHDRTAHVTVHNSSPVHTRQVLASWSLLDRKGEIVAKGENDFKLPPTRLRTFTIALNKYATETAQRPGPLRLQVVASDADDLSVTASREIILSKPDSSALVSDFEADRGYLGLKAYGITNAPPYGEYAASTTAEHAHSGRRSLALPWDKETRVRSFVSIDPPLPGIPTELSVWIRGDGSGVLFYPLIGDTVGVNHGAPQGQWDLFLPRTDGLQTAEPRASYSLQNAVRVDWTGWRELKFRLPPVPPGWDKPATVLGFVPSYPLGVHFSLDAGGAQGDRGVIYADDLWVTTHLEPDERLAMTLGRSGESNVIAPGGQVEVNLANFDAARPRKCRLSGGVFDWRDSRIAGVGADLELAPREQRRLVLAGNLGTGAYAVRATLTAEGRTVGAIDEDLLVADLVPFLGNELQSALRDEWKLRIPIRDRFTFVDEDWDWIEPNPGNFQMDTLRTRIRYVRERGGEPYPLLGYCAYWAGGVGFDQMKRDALARPLRDVGHAIDTFLLPERIEDWDSYACEVMRSVGTEAAGWVVWNNPDGSEPMGVRPDRFALMIEKADRWRRAYCPDKPLLIGGLNPQTAIRYLGELAKHGGLEHMTGVNVRLDVGRLSPEDALITTYIRELRAALEQSPSRTDERAQNPSTAQTPEPSAPQRPKTILLTDLDWAVEKESQGLTGFDQAAYLIRSDLLLDRFGIRPVLSVRNEDETRLGLGLVYRRGITVPPLSEKLRTYQFKPGWWGVARCRETMERSSFLAEIEVQDVIPGRTRCLLYRRTDGRVIAIVWRNDDLGSLSFEFTGVGVESAADMFGSIVPARSGWYSVGKLPVVFALRDSTEPYEQALLRLRVRDGAEAEWPQRVLAAFTPATGASYRYSQTGGEPAMLAGTTVSAEPLQCTGIRFPKGGTESFHLQVPKGAGLVLKKRFLLDEVGQEAEVLVNGKVAGKWDLRRTEKDLSGGMRDAIFFASPGVVGGAEHVVIELHYASAANTAAWYVLEYRGGDFPLSALGPIYADQNVGHCRIGRNMVGAQLKVATTPAKNGLGVFARSLVEYPLDGQFRRFVARVGVDAATEGKGSVVFEVHGDGKKLWASPVMSGLDEPRPVEVNITGVGRLRLIVTDAGDGNRFDAADWCEPVLTP